jgi:hypothetical protein
MCATIGHLIRIRSSDAKNESATSAGCFAVHWLIHCWVVPNQHQVPNCRRDQPGTPRVCPHTAAIHFDTPVSSGRRTAQSDSGHVLGQLDNGCISDHNATGHRPIGRITRHDRSNSPQRFRCRDYLPRSAQLLTLRLCPRTRNHDPRTRRLRLLRSRRHQHRPSPYTAPKIRDTK